MHDYRVIKDPSNWRKYFSKRVLDRGEDYFFLDRVDISVIEDSYISAFVRGRKVYYVSIDVMPDGSFHLECDCPHAEDGNYCKHMAALLFTYEDEFVYESPLKTFWKMEQEQNLVYGNELFPDTDANKKPYYDLQHIAGELKFLKEDVEAAKQIVDSGDLIIRNFSEDFVQTYSGIEKRARVNAVFRNAGEEDDLYLEFTKDKIHKLYCECCNKNHFSYSYSSTGYCPHEIALLLELKDYLYRLNPGDETNAAGERLLALGREISAKERQEQMEQKKDIILEPRLLLNYEGLSVSFKIGVSKTYVVKNLTELCQMVEEKEVLKLGKKHSISFLEETFTDASQPLYNMIQSVVHDFRRFALRVSHAYYYVPSDLAAKNSIPLAGETLDQLYDLMLEQYVPLQDKTGRYQTHAVLFDAQQAMAELTLSPTLVNGVLTSLVAECDLPVILEGAAYSYAFDGGCISRISPEHVAAFQSLQEAMNYAEHNRMVIGQKNIREFYYHVLPMFQQNDAIRVTEKQPDVIQQLLPPDYTFRFYLDTEQGVPFCRGEVSYKDQTFPLKKIFWEELPLEDFRDPNREMDMCELIEKHFSEAGAQPDCFYYNGEEEQLIPAMQEAVKELSEAGEVHATDAFDRLKVRKMPTVKVGVSLESNLLDLTISSNELSLEELLEILGSYQKKKKYHRLRDGRFIGLEQDDTLSSLTELFDSMQISLKDFMDGKMHLPVYRALYLDKMLETHEELTATRDRRFRKILRDFRNVKDADVEIPEHLSETLRPYQTYGVQWIHTLKQIGFGGILADEMGLGKTLQVIAALSADKASAETDFGTALIVCPASLVYNWLEEFHRFAPELHVAVVAGVKADREDLLSKADGFDVLITSYDLLKRDVEDYQDLKFSWQIIDEAQYIKNPKTSGAKAVKIIDANHKLALTGTPIENRLSELWSIFDYLMPGFLYSYSQFQKQLETPIVKFKDKQAEERLRKMIAPFILRRLKQDVLKDLPEKLEEIRYSVFEETQRQLYDAQVAHMKAALDKENDVVNDKIAILAELTKIRQICCDPRLLVDNYKGESAKREACMELIESAVDSGHKILVFSQFTSMLSLLETSMKQYGISYYLLTGATPKEERMRLTKAFNTGDVPVFLISLKAGGTGLNLTGADIVIHYDPWWNLAAQNQATDRAHRIGQKNTVSVYKLIVKGTIEEKIVKLQEEKSDLANAILTGEHTSLAALSKEELYELLS